MKYGMGWRPDKPDQRDRRFCSPIHAGHILADNVSLSSYFPPNYDQSTLGSCTAWGTKSGVWYARTRERLPDIDISALFTYYNSRAAEGTIDSDAGAEIRDVIKVLASHGAAPESDWPYDISKFKQKPPQQAYDDALKDVIQNYARVDQTDTGLRSCVASAWPIVFGMTLYESFQSDAVSNTGLVPMPGADESVVGGHCMIIVGYDNPRRLFEVRNSWGPNWGDKGNCWIPFDYLLNTDLAADFWQIDATSG